MYLKQFTLFLNTNNTQDFVMKSISVSQWSKYSEIKIMYDKSIHHYLQKLILQKRLLTSVNSFPIWEDFVLHWQAEVDSAVSTTMGQSQIIK
jgi:hypothetical protein